MAESAQQHLGDVEPITAENAELVEHFLSGLPAGELAFLKERVDERTVERWIADGVSRWLVVGPGREPQASIAVIPGTGWSAHVGELRLIVGPAHRGKGLGRRLARFGLAQAVRLGMRKVVVDVVADQEGTVEMFTSIGFDAEALLRDHIRTQDGEVHDLVVLAHDVGDLSASLDAIGLGGALGEGPA